MIRIALIGPPDRPEIQRLALRLEERGAQPVFVDARNDPAIRIGRGIVSACGEDLADVRGVYVAEFRLPPPIVRTPAGEIDVEASRPALERSRRIMAAWNSLLDYLAQRTAVVNPPASHDVHSLKPFEAGVYHGAGLPVPVTFSTTDPAYLAALDRGLAREWITKGIVGGQTHTEAIELPDTVETARARLKAAPLLVQERIEGDNVRAFVLDGRVIGAAEVIPLAPSETDSRRGDARVRRIALPDEAARTALEATRRWGMAFSAADFMRPSRGGRHVLLECNSAPFFVNFEARTGLDISGKLADHLIGRRPT